MLGRISFYETHKDIQQALSQRKMEQNKIGNQLATQNKIQELRDDPIAAAHGSRYASMLVRKEALSEQNREVYDTLQFSEGYVRQMVTMLQEGRELAIQAANGTFSSEDRELMAEEVNQLLEEMVTLANARDADGRYIFGGSRTNTPPFRDLRTVSSRLHKDVITDVEYVGSNRANMLAISDDDLVPRAIPGSELFWSGDTQITSGNDVMGYMVTEDSTIVLNNVPVMLSRGDSIHTIIRKINSSSAPLNASLDVMTGQFRLTTTNGEQAWISDEVGDVMQTLGVINGNGAPPYNISGDAIAFEETIFDTMITLRDTMYSDNYSDIGGRALASIDNGISSMLNGLGKIGAITERLDVVYRRLEESDIPNITKQLDSQVSIDIAETIIKWQEVLQAQQAAYQVSSHMMQTSLLQYLQ